MKTPKTPSLEWVLKAAFLGQKKGPWKYPKNKAGFGSNMVFVHWANCCRWAKRNKMTFSLFLFVQHWTGGVMAMGHWEACPPVQISAGSLRRPSVTFATSPSAPSQLLPDPQELITEIFLALCFLCSKCNYRTQYWIGKLWRQRWGKTNDCRSWWE